MKYLILTSLLVINLNANYDIPSDQCMDTLKRYFKFARETLANESIDKKQKEKYLCHYMEELKTECSENLEIVKAQSKLSDYCLSQGYIN